LTFSWSTFDNHTERKTPIAGSATAEIPSRQDGYYAAIIHAGDPSKTVTVYIRRRNGATKVVGIERTW
jgi:hypothetical protein